MSALLLNVLHCGWRPHWMARIPRPETVHDTPRLPRIRRRKPVPDGPTRANRLRAADPATPIAELSRLVEHCADQVAANPAWQLELVANPARLGTLSRGELVALARSGSVDPETLTMVARAGTARRASDSDLGWAVASRAEARPDALEAVLSMPPAGDRSDAFRTIAGIRLRDPGNTLAHWREAIADAYATDPRLGRSILVGQELRLTRDLVACRSLSLDAPIVRVLCAPGQGLSSRELASLRRYGTAEVRTRPAPGRRRLHAATAEDAGTLDRLALLSSTLCPPRRLAAGAREASWFVRACVAANPSASPAVRSRLARDRHWIVRAAALAAGDAACP